nr:MAG TPA: hypothetical protein [Caudoviricetes sp.]
MSIPPGIRSARLLSQFCQLKRTVQPNPSALHPVSDDTARPCRPFGHF